MKPVAREAIGYFTVAMVGLVVDIALATVLHDVFGVALWLSAACGFAVATCFNYLVNIAWTFKGTGTRASGGGLLRYFSVVAVSFVVRLAAIWILEWILPSGAVPTPVILFVAAGASFVTSFVLAKIFVFNAPQAERTDL